MLQIRLLIYDSYIPGFLLGERFGISKLKSPVIDMIVMLISNAIVSSIDSRSTAGELGDL